MVSYKSIGAIAVIVFASAMVGIGVHHLLESGNCSTTGYTRFGPAPRCSSSATAWGIVLPIGLFLIIAAGAAGAPNLFVLLGPLFLAFGLGAMTVRPTRTFAVIFGACFAAVGVGLLAGAVWSARRGSGPRQPSGATGRAVTAIAAWVAALALAFAVASVFPTDHLADAGGPAVTTAFFQPPTLSSTDPSSLYRTDNFKRALTIAGVYLGAGAKVRSVLLVPGGLDVSVALGPRGLQGKEISIDATGGYLSGNVVALKRPGRTYMLTSLDPSTPAALMSRLAAAGKRVGHLRVTAGVRGGVEWLAYPVGGGRPYRLPGG